MVSTRTFIGLGALAVASTFLFDAYLKKYEPEPEPTPVQEREPEQVTIFGKPLSVTYNTYGDRFVAVIDAQNNYGRKIMLKNSRYNSLEAAALIQSEMNDGDDGMVYFSGHFRQNPDAENPLDNFVIDEVSANDITVKLR